MHIIAWRFVVKPEYIEELRKAYGGLTNTGQEILYCVVTRLEIGKIKTIVRGIDEHAFIVSHALSASTRGRQEKRAAHPEIRY